MRFLKWLFLGIGFLLILGAGLTAGSVYLALDWDRTHSAETSALPFYQGDEKDGLYQIRANGLIFRARIYGAANDGPGIIMLHGHPETSIMWDRIAPAIAEQGYRIIAFDQRGYSPGARPKGIAPYRPDNQVADVLAIADAMGFEQFHLVGHDWGAVIGWATAILQKDRLTSLTAMSIPHPQTLISTVVDDTPDYIRIFSIPFLAEASLLMNDLDGYHELYTEQSDEEIAEYVQTFSEPGAATAALNWYRNLQEGLSLITNGDTSVAHPVLFIYGDDEFWVTPEYLTEQRSLVGEQYLEIELEAGHWLVQKHPGAIQTALIDHLERAQYAP